MIDEILGKEAAGDIFMASMLTGLMNEAQLANISKCIEKTGAVSPLDILSTAGKGISNVAGGAYKAVGDVIKNAPTVIGTSILGGAGVGAIGAMAYDAIKENVSHEDPEVEFNRKIEEIYRNKKLEKEDAKWIKRVRTLRDELRRGYKKMSTEEYSRKYKALMDALDERK